MHGVGLRVKGVLTKPGNEKRVNELYAIFESPPTYGIGLNWTGYSLFDAATILHLYLLSFPLFTSKHHTAWTESLPKPNPDRESAEYDRVVRTHQALTAQLPSLHQCLIFYLLDLFAIFAQYSEVNLGITEHIAEKYVEAFVPATSDLSQQKKSACIFD